MSNQYYIQSLLASGYVIDIGIGGGGNPPSERALLNLHTLNNGGNQLWSFEAAPEHPGYFFIRSALADKNGETLAIDVRGDGNAQPTTDDTLLQVYEKADVRSRL